MTSMFSVKSYGKAKLAVLEKQSRNNPYLSPTHASYQGHERKPLAPWKTRLSAPGFAKKEPVGDEAVETEADDGDDEARVCMVYVGNLSYSATYHDLKEHMDQAGAVLFVRINEGPTGSKGSGCVRFETAAGAQKAIEELDGSMMKWRKITVGAWTGKVGNSGQNNDWRDLDFGSDPDAVVFVGKLDFRTQSWLLKEHMEQAAPVEFCRVLTDNNQRWGNPKGCAFVRFASAAGAQAARERLNGQELLGRKLIVDRWGKLENPLTAPDHPNPYVRQT